MDLLSCFLFSPPEFHQIGITLHGCPGFGCLRGQHSHNEEEDGPHHYPASTDGGRALAKQQNGKLPNDKPHIELEIVSSDTSENGINLNKIDAENSQKKLANIKRTKNDHNHSHRHGHHSHNHDHESINVRAAIIHVLGRHVVLWSLCESSEQIVSLRRSNTLDLFFSIFLHSQRHD